jgi:MFS family permease
MVAAFTVMAIIAADLSGSRAWAGVPILSMFVGRFLASYMMGRLMDQWGRRPALVAAFAIGVVGASLAVTAVMARSFGGFVLAALVFGMARGGAEQMRFIAAEIQAPGQRARAIGLIVFAGTIGSIAGPWFYQLTSSAASSRGYDPGVGPWAIAALLMGLGAVVLFVTLRPDPRELGRRIEAATSAAGNVSVRAMTTIFALPRVRLAVISIAIGQVVMTILMSVTPLHMIQEGFQAGDISVVMAAHMLGMFGLAPLTGWLVDRIGPYWMIGLGALTLVITSGLALVAVGLESLAAALFMLGLGWNLTFVAGSALLMNMVTQAERARSQGVAEMINSVAGGLAALGSGLLLDLGGMPMLASGGLMLTGILVVAQAWILAIRARLRPIGAESAAVVAVEAD